ncbi:tetratricopeptide repeat protein [Lutimaribacter marinistellae]|uniref:Tetratricopeptide repeat protein n=1 Tax=Lutimaribacter marinistellae TaxID=1820329 RepID=A0ABV7TC33_9RHOB
MAVLSASFFVPFPATAENNAGSYLAGRQAIARSDFAKAAEFYTRALARDPSNPTLMESVVLSRLAMGEIDRALPVALQMEESGLRSQVAHMVVQSSMLANEDYAGYLDRDPDTQGIGKLADGLLAGWAHLAAGSVGQALAQFDRVGDTNGVRNFALYHKALALASVGDYEGAEAIFAANEGAVTTLSRRAAMARAEVLSQLDRNDEALEMLADVFGASFDPGLTAVADRLASGETLSFSHVRTPQDGLAEVFFTIGAALNDEAADDFVLIYARAAGYLRPDHIDAILLSAELLEDMGQFDLSVATYRKVPQDSADHHAAEMGRAEALRRAGKPDAAIEVLESLAMDYPTLPLVHSSLGDLQRQQEEYDAAIKAYDKALEFLEEGDNREWFVHYARGISHERLKQWDQAEADFRRALELNPEQPQVLNYLGYSLVERKTKLEEALDMIERAAAARPDSGYIIDSLGWVLFRLGRYEEAVTHMERAVELMPVDPVVNDHLGDVYWAVGRMREAEFQWSRALSFVDPEDENAEANPERIRAKLEVGLDEVLAQEGAEPIQVANDQ